MNKRQRVTIRARTIVVHDNAGDSISSKDQNYTFDYPVVVPEFPSGLILPVFMAATLAATIFCRRRRSI